MSDRKGALKLRPVMLAIAGLPFIVILMSFLLIPFAGSPVNPLARAIVENGHAEAAGRLKMLATWLLLLTIGLVCIGYFVMNLRLFEGRTRSWLIGAFVALAGVGIASMVWGLAEGPRLMGERAICAALSSHSAPPARSERDVFNAQQSTEGPAPTDNSLANYNVQSAEQPSEGWLHLRQPDCPENAIPRLMRLMWQLNFVQRLLLALVSPALVLGTIACLALPPPRAPKPKGQSPADRLKIHLYLTAALFVSGLLFLSALLRWPAFAFQGAGHDAYLAHVDAFVLYWGVTYTLYIASYYVPVALLLTAQGKRAGVDEDKLPAGQLLDWTKTLAALFAPAIVGLLGNVIHL